MTIVNMSMCFFVNNISQYFISVSELNLFVISSILHFNALHYLVSFIVTFLIGGEILIDLSVFLISIKYLKMLMLMVLAHI